MTNLSFKNLLKPCIFALGSALALTAAVPTALAQTPSRPIARVTAQIDDQSRVTLAGSHTVRAQHDAGAVSPSLQLHGISLIFSLSAAQQQDLDALLAAQQNPASPLYHQWITPAQYAARFGAADADIATTKSWLEREGFSVDSVSNSRTRIFFSGTAAQVASAFGAPLHNFTLLATATHAAETHFAPASDLSIPAALAPAVLAIGNLSSFRLHSQATHPVKPQFTSGQTGSYFLTPLDLETIYDVKPAISSGLNGSGQTIAVIGQSEVATSDVTNFQTALGIPTKVPNILLVPGSGDPAISTGDESESDLDLEYSGALAPGANIDFYYTGSNANYGVFNALEYVVDYGFAPIITLSYGACESDVTQANISSFDLVLKQAATQGQTVIAASGDDGSTACAEDTSLTAVQQEALGVNYPASSVYVTGMGGTEFLSADVASTNSTYFTSATGTTDLISSAKSYIPEQVWNDDAANVTLGVQAGTSPLSASGGGVSIYETRPTWQTGVPGIPSGTFRLVPDISLTASPNNAGFLYCSSDTSNNITGSCTDGFRDANDQYLTVAGGTSFDAPIFAGLVALINQSKGYTKGQGLVNPTLYTLASNSATYASAFHDITSGNNACDAGTTYCGVGAQTTDYAATTGYDEATGLGSIDFDHLLTAWPANTAVVSTLASTTTLSAATTAPASGATDVITITVASGVTSSTVAPTGTVSVAVNGTVVNGSLALTNGVATYTFSSTTSGSSIIQATYSGDSVYSPSAGAISVIIPTVATSGGTGTSTVTITPGGGYTGTVDMGLSTNSTDVANDACFSYANSAPIVSSTTAVTDVLTLGVGTTACANLAAKGYPIHSFRRTTAHVASNRIPTRPNRSLPFSEAAFGFVGLLFAGFAGKRSRLLRANQFRALCCMLALLPLGFLLSGCSNNGSTTAVSKTITLSANPTTITISAGTSGIPTGTYPLTVTGNDSITTGIANTTTISLVID